MAPDSDIFKRDSGAYPQNIGNLILMRSLSVSRRRRSGKKKNEGSLGSIFDRFGRSCGVLRGSWADFGSFGSLGGPLGASWVVLGTS